MRSMALIHSCRRRRFHRGAPHWLWLSCSLFQFSVRLASLFSCSLSLSLPPLSLLHRNSLIVIISVLLAHSTRSRVCIYITHYYYCYQRVANAKRTRKYMLNLKWVERRAKGERCWLRMLTWWHRLDIVFTFFQFLLAQVCASDAFFLSFHFTFYI